MSLDKILKKLTKNLKQGEKQSANMRCDRIDALLEKLEAKKKKLESQASSELNKSKRKKLKLELRIASVELKKGLKRRQELKNQCK